MKPQSYKNVCILNQIDCNCVIVKVFLTNQATSLAFIYLWVFKFLRMIKKTLLILFIIITTLVDTEAQPLQGGEQLVKIGLGVAALPKHEFTSKTPSFTLSYEKNVSDLIGVGYFSAGALFSVASSYLDYQVDGNTFTHGNNFSTFAAKGVYHFDMVKLTDDVKWNKLDVYAGAILGFTLKRGQSDENDDITKRAYLATDIFVGARYNFYDKIGVFMEAGYGITYVKAGLSIQF